MSTVRAGIGHMVHSIQNYPVQTHSRSQFNKTHDLITCFDGGLLVPIWRRYGYPGDTLKLDISALVRLSAQIVPFMTNILMDVHLWKVPIRLIWPHFLNMQGQQDNPGDSTDYLVPVISSGLTGFDFNSIFDHFDYVPGVPNYSATSLFLRSYNLVWNEWYRDENLQERVPQETSDTDLADNYTLLPRGKRKDYFTGALPWPQKGEDVLLPLGQTAPVSVYGNNMALGLSTNNVNLASLYNTSQNGTALGVGSFVKGSSATASAGGIANNTLIGVTSNPDYSGLVGTADLSQATSATMSQLYMANAVQQILQLDARSGTRYIELLLGRWGVISSDSRLQRPEFLGGGTFDLNTSIVPQTSSTDGTSPQANLAAFSTINGSTKTIVTSFEEHCVVFAVASIRPATYYYQQGLDRDFRKRSRFDFYEPGLANLPEQTIFNSEIYLQPDTVQASDGTLVNDGVFGYQERFAEDKTAYSRIHSYMRSTAPQSLDMWHLAVEYGELPKLNAEFIVEDLEPLKRVLAVYNDPDASEDEQNIPQFLANFHFKETWIKEMPLFSNPSLMKF